MLAIISMGVIIFGKGKIFVDTMDKQLSQSDIQNHNAQFTRFEGNVSGAEVKNACNAVAQTNEKNKVISMQIIVLEKNGTQFAKHSKTNDNLNKIMNQVSNTQMFKGSVTYNSEGIIDTLTFKKQ